MKIERLIEGGLLLGGSGKEDLEGMATRDRDSMHMHGQALRNSADSSTEDEDEQSHVKKEDRRASVISELKRQGSVFYDDSEIDGEDSGMTEDETAVVRASGHDRGE